MRVPCDVIISRYYCCQDLNSYSPIILKVYYLVAKNKKAENEQDYEKISSTRNQILHNIDYSTPWFIEFLFISEVRYLEIFSFLCI